MDGEKRERTYIYMQSLRFDEETIEGYLRLKIMLARTISLCVFCELVSDQEQ